MDKCIPTIKNVCKRWKDSNLVLPVGAYELRRRLRKLTEPRAMFLQTGGGMFKHRVQFLW